MDLPQISPDTYYAICLVIATPWLIHVFKPFSTVKPARPRIEQVLSTALLLHTLYILHALLLSPPQNIFKALGLGLHAPPEHLRAKLAESYGGEQNFPAHLQLLLKRLGLMDLRSLYVRFGHDVLTTCSYCHSYDDFALYAFPAPLLEYIRELAFVGLLTLTNSPVTAYRPLGLGALLAALLTEAYWTLTVQAIVPTAPSSNLQLEMWHDTFVQYRHILFLTLPLVLTILPSLGLHRVPLLRAFVPIPDDQVSANLPPSQYLLQSPHLILPPNTTLAQTSALTMQTLQHLVPTLHLLKYTHAAIMRSQWDINSTGGEESINPSPEAASPSTSTSIHARASRWWSEEAREGEIVRNDAEVLRVLKLSGAGLDQEIKNDSDAVVQPEGQLSGSAKAAATLLKDQGAVPSQHWTAAH